MEHFPIRVKNNGDNNRWRERKRKKNSLNLKRKINLKSGIFFIKQDIFRGKIDRKKIEKERKNAGSLCPLGRMTHYHDAKISRNAKQR